MRSRTRTDVSIPRCGVITRIPKLSNLERLRAGIDLVVQPPEQGKVYPAGSHDEPFRGFQEFQLVAGSDTQRVENMFGKCYLARMVVAPPLKS